MEAIPVAAANIYWLPSRIPSPDTFNKISAATGNQPTLLHFDEVPFFDVLAIL